MITRLKLTNFKSHRNTELNTKPLTLITGVNNCGKSSILQALLLLRQSYKKGRLDKGLDLNEPLVSVGVGNDALYRMGDPELAFEFDCIGNDSEIENYRFAFDAVNGVLKDAFEAGDGKYMADENGNALQIFNRKVSAVDTAEDPTKTETLFTVQNLVINEDLMQIPTKLGFVKPDGSVDYETVDKLKKMFEEANYTLNPTASTMLNINSFYAAFVSDIANIGSVVKNVRDNEQLTVDSTENARQQIIGVSTDEELSNMIRYQNAYNASSRYINVINEMLEHLLTSLT